jgi:hypothetical protein
VAVRLNLGTCSFVFWTDVAALDPQRTRPVDADEDARSRDVVGIIFDRPFLERSKSRLDLSQALVDLLRELVGFCMGFLGRSYSERKAAAVAVSSSLIATGSPEIWRSADVWP